MKKRKLQGNKAILISYLKTHGSITQYEAMTKLGIGRLSERIRELKRMGYKIHKTDHGGYKNTVIGQYARYWLVEEAS